MESDPPSVQELFKQVDAQLNERIGLAYAIAACCLIAHTRNQVAPTAVFDYRLTWVVSGGRNEMQLMDKQMQMLFPTPMFGGKVSDLGACDRVERKLREMQKLGQGPKHAFGDYAFLTADDIQTLPEMKELVDMIMYESGQILDLYKIKRQSHYITNMWANITHPNHRHHMHIHPNCLFSGIIYIKAPQNCGPTIFFDPRINARMIEPTYTENNVFNSAVLTIPAEKGRMLIWPSYLSHGVDNGTAKDDEDRIVVAFNIMIRGLIERRTARLELK